MKKPDAQQISELRRIWSDGRSAFAMFLLESQKEADKALRSGEGAELHRKQGEAMVIDQLISHCSGASSGRQMAPTQPI